MLDGHKDRKFGSQWKLTSHFSSSFLLQTFINNKPIRYVFLSPLPQNNYASKPLFRLELAKPNF